MIPELTWEQRWECLQLGLRRVAKTYLVIDGLDELDPSQSSKLFLERLVELVRHRPAQAKFVVTSQSTPYIEEAMKRAKPIVIRCDEETHITNDTATILTYLLAASGLTFEEKSLIEEKILDQTKSSLLYAKLALDFCLSPGKNMKMVIESLPKTLFQLYDKLLAQYARQAGVSTDFQVLVLQLAILQLPPRVGQPITPEGVAGLVHFAQVLKEDSEAGVSASMILDSCGSLMRVSAAGKVGVVHHSFLDFLASTTTGTLEREFPVIQAGDSHWRLALICLDYLQAEVKRSLAIDSSTHYLPWHARDAMLAKDASMGYAASNWFKHLRRAESAGISKESEHDIISTLDLLFSSPSFHYIMALSGFADDCRWYDWMVEEEAPGVTPLYAACLLGIDEYFYALVSRPGTEVNHGNNKEESPLCYAARHGNVRMVTALLKAGARSDERDKKSFSGLAPLHHAVSNKHAAVIKVLLENGADPMQVTFHNDPCSIGYVDPSALELACQAAEASIFELFVPYIKSKDMMKWVIDWITPTGCVDVLAVALAHPLACINEKTRLVTPLFVASGQRDPVMVDALLKAGADATILHDSPGEGISPAGEGNTALHAWAAFDSQLTRLAWQHHGRSKEYSATATTKVFDLLVAAGANINQLNAMGNMPIHYAQDALAAKLLVNGGADANIENRRAETLLHLTCDMKTLRYLLEEVKVATTVNSRGESPMLTRMSPGSGSVDAKHVVHQIELFLDNGADPAVVDRDGDTALHRLVAQKRLSDKDEEDSRLTLMERLIQAGLDVNLQNAKGQTPMHLLPIVTNERLKKKNKRLMSTLVAAGADLNATDNLGQTPIFFQLKNGDTYKDADDVESCSYLIKHGARLDIHDASGRTVLYAIQKPYNIKLLQWLIDHGSDPKVTDNQGNSLFHELIPRWVKFSFGKNRHSFVFLEKVVDLGVDPELPNNKGQTPLHIASSFVPGGGPTNLFQWFLDRQHNVDAADEANVTALHLTSTFSEDLTRKLLMQGADPLRQTREGLNALHCAARARQVNIVGLILETIRARAGNDQEFQTMMAPSIGNIPSPLFYACASGRPESVRLLLDAGMTIHLGSYQNSALQGAVLFEREEQNWLNGSAYQTHNARDVGSVSLQDDFRTAMKSGPVPSERINEILEMLSQQTSFVQGHIHEAIREAITAGAAYTLECLLQLRTRFAMKSSLPDDGTTNGLLVARNAERQAYAAKLVSGESLTAQEFTAAMKNRLFDIVAAALSPDSVLQVIQSSHQENTILQQLVKGGYASLLEKVANSTTIAALNNRERVRAIDGYQGDAMPLLITACRREIPNMEVLRILVEHFGVDVNEGLSENSWQLSHCREEIASPLHALAMGGHWWQVSLAMPYLIAHGADVNLKIGGKTVLEDVLETMSARPLAVSERAIQVLLEAGADTTPSHRDGRSFVSNAIQHIGILKLLLKYNTSVTSQDLIAAITHETLEGLEALLEAGADPNSGDILTEEVNNNPSRYPKIDQFPLYHAMVCGASASCKISMMKLLLAYGADPLAKYKTSTILYKCFEQRAGRPLCWLLEQKIPGLNPNMTDANGVTLFHLACQYGLEKEKSEDEQGDVTYHRIDDKPTPAEHLLQLGADIRATDIHGSNCLHRLVNVKYEHCDLSMIKHMIKVAPELVNQSNDGGKTPLHLAVTRLEFAGLEVIDALLAAGADVSAKDAKGNTVLHYLLQKNFRINKATGEVDSARRVLFDRLMAVPEVDINATNDEGETAVFTYIRHGYGRCIDATLCDKTEENKKKWEAAVLDLFDAHGAQWDVRNLNGETLIHAALHCWGWDTHDRWPIRVKYLIDKGVDAFAKDKNGVTASNTVRTLSQGMNARFYTREQDVLPRDDVDGL